MDFFNFSNSLTKWVKIMYSNTRCKIVNNGYFSESFDCQEEVNKGVRCHHIYSLWPSKCQLLKSDPITTEDQKSKTWTNADDSTFILSMQTKSLLCLIENLANFSVLSGLKPNYDVYNIMYWTFKKYNFYITLQFTYKMG